MKKLLLFSFIFSMTIGFTACKKASENVTEKMIEKSLGEKANVDLNDEKMTITTDDTTISTDGTAKSWPKEIPSWVPEFTSGDISLVSTRKMEDGESWTMVYDNVGSNALAKYKEVLTDQGFKILVATEMAEGGSLSASKGKSNIFILAGDGNASVAVSLEK